MSGENPEIATVSDSDDDSDDEELKKVLEMSLHDTGGPGTSAQQKEGDDDSDEELKRVMEMSLLQEQPLIKLTGTMVSSKGDDDDDDDSEAELEEALRRSLLDMENAEAKVPEKSGTDKVKNKSKSSKAKASPSYYDTEDIEDDLATLEENGCVESDQENNGAKGDDSITKDLQEIEAIGMIDNIKEGLNEIVEEDAVKNDLAGIEQFGVIGNREGDTDDDNADSDSSDEKSVNGRNSNLDDSESDSGSESTDKDIEDGKSKNKNLNSDNNHEHRGDDENKKGVDSEGDSYDEKNDDGKDKNVENSDDNDGEHEIGDDINSKDEKSDYKKDTNVDDSDSDDEKNKDDNGNTDNNSDINEESRDFLQASPSGDDSDSNDEKSDDKKEENVDDSDSNDEKNKDGRGNKVNNIDIDEESTDSLQPSPTGYKQVKRKSLKSEIAKKDDNNDNGIKKSLSVMVKKKVKSTVRSKECKDEKKEVDDESESHDDEGGDDQDEDDDSNDGGKNDNRISKTKNHKKRVKSTIPSKKSKNEKLTEVDDESESHDDEGDDDQNEDDQNEDDDSNDGGKNDNRISKTKRHKKRVKSTIPSKKHKNEKLTEVEDDSESHDDDQDDDDDSESDDEEHNDDRIYKTKSHKKRDPLVPNDKKGNPVSDDDSSVEENYKDTLRNNTNQEEEDKEGDDDDDNANNLPRRIIEKSNLKHKDHLLSDDSTINDSPIDLNHGPVDLTDAKCNITVDLTQVTPKKFDVIEISDDEVESLGNVASSSRSLISFNNPQDINNSILIESDTSPANQKSKPDLAAIGARLGFAVSITPLKEEGQESGIIAQTSSSNTVNTVLLSDSDDDVVVLDSPANSSYQFMPPVVGVSYYQPIPFQPALSNEEVTKKMKSVFESGLAIHFSGEEMEACKAVSTPLFPHQRVALAWMFRHENKENDGMRGGILADDMGLGKTLTVIALIMTNHWDGKPLSKPELGKSRHAFKYGKKTSRSSKGKGKGKSLVVGSKINGGKKKTIGGLFDKFNDTTDSDSESDSDYEKKKKFKKKRNEDDDDEMKDFIVDDSSKSDSNSSSKESEQSQSEDEFDKMSKDTSLQEKLNSSAKSLFNSSARDIFKNIESPLKDIKFHTKEKERDPNSDELDEEDKNMTQEELMLSMIPTALDGTFDMDFDQKLNVDGFMDDSSSDEDFKPTKKVPGTDLLDSDDELINNSTQATTSVKATVQNDKRKRDIEETKQEQHQRKRLKKRKVMYSGSESDISLPEVESDSSNASVKGEPSKKKEESDELEPENAIINKETGLKLIIPPKEPADRQERRRATLLVCPTSLVSHWADQLHQHLHKGVDIKLKVHHGAGKALTGADLESHDIVITTYGTLAAEWGAGTLSPLSRAKWLRVVLDEGHNIKNHHTKSAKAALGLDTLRRWIVTGTPIQNNLMELWSLVNWLDFGMYAGKSQMHKFKDQIEGPCKKGNPRGFERLQVLVDAICLRRTKTDKKPDGSPLVVLPSKTILTREVVMNEEERLCYGIYLKRAKEIVNRFNRDGDLLRNYAHVFALMTRLRQLCCHRELIKEVDWTEALKDKEGLAKQLEGFLNKDEITKNSEQAGTNSALEINLEKRLMGQLRDMIRSGVSDDCSVCLDDLKSPVITPCAHVFCRTCIEAVLDTVKPPSCPLCRIELTKKQLLEAGQDENLVQQKDNTLADMKDIEVNVSSSKVNAVLKEILRIQRDLPDDKVVVVSQFSSFLSILQPIMKLQNFSIVRLDGSMSFQDRSEVVRQFQSTKKNSPKLMLLSLKAGGVGLNLTAANHLLLLDPAWNPASEWQCFDRTHRLGQKKNVFIYKYINKDSIEEKMLEIQAKKKDLISGAFHMPEDDRRRQRVQDIMSIFGI